jgi:hypothetical protein
MSTTAQQLAAAANAQLSTGPRSPEGKANSSRNSLKLGLYARTLLLPGEDPAGLDELTRDFEARFNPQGPIESQLLEDAVRALWLKRRCYRIENEIIRARLAALPPEDQDNPLGNVFIQDAEGANVLEKVFRRQQAADRQYRRAIADLTALQAARFIPDPDPVIDRPAPARASNPVRFDKPSKPPAYTGGPTPFSTPRDNWDNPALRL